MIKKKPVEYSPEIVHLIEQLVSAQDRKSSECSEIQRFAMSLLDDWDRDRCKLYHDL